MRAFDETTYREIAETLRQRVAAHAPDWADHTDSDPGVTLVQLFAFLTEAMLYRANLLPERGRMSAIRLAQSALVLAAAGAASGPLERPRYFAGQLVGVDDFRLEQDYFRSRLRRLNRALYGSGIVQGLGVSIEGDGAGGQVAVEPGLAIDRHGEEIEVPNVATVSLPQGGGPPVYVILLRTERPTHPRPTTGGTEFTRIEEAFEVRIETATAGDGVVLARLLGADGRWHIDPAFAPPRTVCLDSLKTRV
jgi:hypothetical protein